jgi:hypothetical protein
MQKQERPLKEWTELTGMQRRSAVSSKAVPGELLVDRNGQKHVSKVSARGQKLAGAARPR